MEACRTNNGIKLDFFATLGHEAFLGNVTNIVPFHVDIVAAQGLQIPLTRRLSTAADGAIGHKYIIDLLALFSIAKSRLHRFLVGVLSLLLLRRSLVHSVKVSVSAARHGATMFKEIFGIFPKSLQRGLCKVQALVGLGVVASGLVNARSRGNPRLRSDEGSEMARD